jgi:2',3'-cyclic-nucleotide 2'-phosphodiesterase (5'-nucleotidase family)
MGAKLDAVVGASAVDLDARFAVIRSRESNMGNLMADVLRAATASDIAIINSGGRVGAMEIMPTISAHVPTSRSGMTSRFTATLS